MTAVSKYRVWCSTEGAYKYVWRDDVEGAPTACPNDPTHTIDANKITVVETAGAATPVKGDGTPVVALNPAAVGSPLRPLGLAKKITLPQADPVIIDVPLAETRYLNGAEGKVWGDFTPGEGGDHIMFYVVAPDGQGGWVVVGQFSDDLFLADDGKLGPFVSEETTKVPAGLRFRVIYHAVGTTGEINLVAWIRTYMEPST